MYVQVDWHHWKFVFSKSLIHCKCEKRRLPHEQMFPERWIKMNSITDLFKWVWFMQQILNIFFTISMCVCVCVCTWYNFSGSFTLYNLATNIEFWHFRLFMWIVNQPTWVILGAAIWRSKRVENLFWDEVWGQGQSNKDHEYEQRASYSCHCNCRLES